MVLIGFIGMFGMKFPRPSALMTKEVFGTGATAFGAASSMLALGALSGALLAARGRTGRGCGCWWGRAWCSASW